MKTTMMITAAVLMTAATLMASTTEKRIPTLKVGKCTLTLLDSNGIKPLSGATLDLKQADNGKTAVSAVANKSGQCEITVAEGRYILSINEKPITLVNASKDGELAWARIVVGDSPMMVGGQEPATTTATFTFLGLSGPAAVSAAVAAGVITVGAGGAIIYNAVDDDDDDDDDNQQQQQQPSRPRPVSP